MSESDLKALDPALCLSAVEHRAEVAEARLHALARRLEALVLKWQKAYRYAAAHELQMLLARVETPDVSTALVPHPSLGDESTGSTEAEPFGISQTPRNYLLGTVAQLRHAYQQVKGGHVRDLDAFAEGLIAPQIRRLEALLALTESAQGQSAVDPIGRSEGKTRTRDKELS